MGLLILLFWTSDDICSGFQSQGGPLLCAFSLVLSSDSPLLWHLLVSWWPAWQPNLFHPRTSRSCILCLAYVHTCLCTMHSPPWVQHLPTSRILKRQFFCRAPSPFGGRSFSTTTMGQYSEPCLTSWYLLWSQKSGIGWVFKIVRL